jgi:hypothetical protein
MRSWVDPRVRASRDSSHQALPPRRHACLRGVIVAHVPPRSTAAPPLPPHRHAHPKGPLPRAPQRDVVALVPPGFGAAVAATSPSCAPHGVAAACVPLGSDIATTPTSRSCAPQGGHHRALASGTRHRKRVPQIRRRALAPRIRHHAHLSGVGA